MFTDLTNTPSLYLKGYGLVGADFSYRTDHWRMSLFGKNLQNTVYYENNARSFSYVAFGGSPRTYGVQLDWQLYELPVGLAAVSFVYAIRAPQT